MKEVETYSAKVLKIEEKLGKVDQEAHLKKLWQGVLEMAKKEKSGKPKKIEQTITKILPIKFMESTRKKLTEDVRGKKGKEEMYEEKEVKKDIIPKNWDAGKRRRFGKGIVFDNELDEFFFGNMEKNGTGKHK